MPMVGDKKFPYTPAGKKAAKMYAKAEGMESKALKKQHKKECQLHHVSLQLVLRNLWLRSLA